MTPESWLALASWMTIAGLLLFFLMLSHDAPSLFPKDDDRCGWLAVLLEWKRREQRRQKWERFRIGR